MWRMYCQPDRQRPPQLSMGADDTTFDHSTFSANRERFMKHDVGQRLFKEVVEQAKAASLLSPEHLSVRYRRDLSCRVFDRDWPANSVLFLYDDSAFGGGFEAVYRVHHLTLMMEY